MTKRFENEPFSAVFIPKTFIKTFYDRSFSMDYHAHDNLELMYLVSGRMRVDCIDGSHTRFEPHQAVLILHNRFHRLVACSDDIELLVLELASPADDMPLDLYIAESPAFSPYPSLVRLMKDPASVLSFSDTDNVYETMSHLLKILHERNRGVLYEFFELDYEISVKQLLLSLCRCRTVYLEISDNRHINRAMDFIRSRYAEAVTVRSVADYIGVTPSYAQKLFRAATGMTIMHTIDYYRLRQSEYLLATTSLPLVVIARKTGFNTQNNFYKHFRAKYGCSPTEYRETISRDSFYNFDPLDIARSLTEPARRG